MAPASKRVKSASINPKVVTAVYAVLEKLPAKPKERYSLREAVTQLKGQIQDALSKGYSYQDVADMLAKQGIDISASTLKNYVPSGKRKSSAQTAAKPKSTRGRKPMSKLMSEPLFEEEEEEEEVVPVKVPAKRGPKPSKAPAAKAATPAKRGPKAAAKAAPAPAAATPRTRRKRAI